MMPTWEDDYSGALEARDVFEKSGQEAFYAYTRLADEHASALSSRDVAPGSSPVPQDIQASQSAATLNIAAKIPPAILGSDAAAPASRMQAGADQIRLRVDLASANRNLLGLNNQVLALRNDIEKLRVDAGTRDARVSELDGSLAKAQAEKLALARKLRDRESELREKARLVGEVQDEMVSLEMQLNVSEERSKKLERENQELVGRWMRRMGREADAMNEGSGW